MRIRGGKKLAGVAFCGRQKDALAEKKHNFLIEALQRNYVRCFFEGEGRASAGPVRSAPVPSRSEGNPGVYPDRSVGTPAIIKKSSMELFLIICRNYSVEIFTFWLRIVAELVDDISEPSS